MQLFPSMFSEPPREQARDVRDSMIRAVSELCGQVSTSLTAGSLAAHPLSHNFDLIEGNDAAWA
jgi:hypothetical protein